MARIYDKMSYTFPTCITFEVKQMAKGKHLYGLPKGKHVFGTAKVGEKGQIVIPKEARELFGIKAGDTLLILGDESSGIIVSRPKEVQELAEKIFKNMEENQ